MGGLQCVSDEVNLAYIYLIEGEKKEQNVFQATKTKQILNMLYFYRK